MKIIAIIQARLGSERLPNKVLLQIPRNSGMSMLELVVRKALLGRSLNDVLVVTPDRFIAVLCNRWRVKAYMPYWKERDVLREFYVAATDLQANVILRLTADCPLLQTAMIDNIVEEYLSNPVDLVYNTDENTGQLNGEGSDVEVMSYDALEKAHNNAKGEAREHVTLWIRQHLTTRFVPCASLGIRSVNTQEDYEWVCAHLIENQ